MPERIIQTSTVRRLWGGLGIVWLTAIIALSLMPAGAPLPGFHWSDKVAHATAYAGLMGWFAQLTEQARHRVALAGILVVLGLALEGLQGLQPTRATEWGDAVANTLGVLAGWGLAAHTALGRILAALEARFARTQGRMRR